jgi:RNA polymerase sigma factor (sigma-70 family)
VTDQRSFEALVLPCLDSAYNLARWLLNDETAAEDVVQEASLRAFRYFHSFKGGEARPWFLGIVRNSCFTYLEERKGRNEQFGLEDEELESHQWRDGRSGPDPVVFVEQGREREAIDGAIRELSPRLREVFILREIEGLDYADIASVAAIPIGTVMSRLSRARSQLKAALVRSGIRE